jgi:hypothetical protein
MKILLLGMMLSFNAMAFSTLNCTSNDGVSYSYNNRAGGARPYPGMITSVEEVKIKGELVFRKVGREECTMERCENQPNELPDIGTDLIFSFLNYTKSILESEGDEMGPFLRETYAIQFQMEKTIWMICDSSKINAP